MFRRLLALTAAGCLAGAAWAAEPQDDLQELRQKIDSLKQDMQENEADRHEAADALKSSEQAISEANRAMAELGRQQQLSQQELARVNADIDRTRARLERNRARLAELIRARYRNGEHEALRLLLNKQDPNQLSRDLRYYRYIAEAQHRLSSQLQEQLGKLDALAEVIRQKQEELNRIAAERKRQRDKLRAQQAEKQQVLSKLSDEIGAQRKQIGKLQADEKRLTVLMEKLARLSREREAREERERARKEQARKLAQAREAARIAKANKSGKPAEAGRSESTHNETVRNESGRGETERSENGALQSAEQTAKPEAALRRNEAVPDSSAEGRRFAELKGQLRLPARGEVIGRFGTPRSEGTAWRGVFIRAGSGQGVKAVAGGRVVFADWLRGFGNMLIVDHGGGYMSLYGAAEALMKRVGDTVRAGDDVATSGNSGGSEQTGIYFEIRYLGKPVDPLAWAK